MSMGRSGEIEPLLGYVQSGWVSKAPLKEAVVCNQVQQWDVGVCEWDLEPDPFLAVGS